MNPLTQASLLLLCSMVVQVSFIFIYIDINQNFQRAVNERSSVRQSNTTWRRYDHRCRLRAMTVLPLVFVIVCTEQTHSWWYFKILKYRITSMFHAFPYTKVIISRREIPYYYYYIVHTLVSFRTKKCFFVLSYETYIPILHTVCILQ